MNNLFLKRNINIEEKAAAYRVIYEDVATQDFQQLPYTLEVLTRSVTLQGN